MKAETAYNVIQALPEKEYARLLQMMGVTAKPKKKKKKEPLITDEEAREYLLKYLFNK